MTERNDIQFVVVNFNNGPTLRSTLKSTSPYKYVYVCLMEKLKRWPDENVIVFTAPETRVVMLPDQLRTNVLPFSKDCKAII